jgi:hypothetical protein
LALIAEWTFAGKPSDFCVTPMDKNRDPMAGNKDSKHQPKDCSRAAAMNGGVNQLSF